MSCLKCKFLDKNEKEYSKMNQDYFRYGCNCPNANGEFTVGWGATDSDFERMKCCEFVEKMLEE